MYIQSGYLKFFLSKNNCIHINDSNNKAIGVAI